MAKKKATKNSKRSVNKAQAVRDYLAAHPDAKNPEVKAALTKKGIDITTNYVSIIRGQGKRAKAPKKADVKGDIAVSELRAAMALVKAAGSFEDAAQALAIVKEIQEA